MLKVLRQLMSGADAIQAKDIGVITPYSGQVHLLLCDSYTAACTAVGAYCTMLWCFLLLCKTECTTASAEQGQL